ncbi:14809_t:CDS:2, partial [Funneliformis geosporum]
MTKKNSEQKQKQRGRSSSPTSSIYGTRPFTFEKRQKKETLEDTSENTTTTLDVDACFDASENFLDKNTSSIQDFEHQKPSFHGYFPLEEFPGTSPRQKVSFVVDMLFDKYNSFSEERDHVCSVPLSNLENRTFLPLDV